VGLVGDHGEALALGGRQLAHGLEGEGEGLDGADDDLLGARQGLGQLTVTRRGTGVPTLAAAGADRIAVDMMVEQVNRSVTIYNNGDRWALTGV
jgi:hypothetical protein